MPVILKRKKVYKNTFKNIGNGIFKLIVFLFRYPKQIFCVNRSCSLRKFEDIISGQSAAKQYSFDISSLTADNSVTEKPCKSFTCPSKLLTVRICLRCCLLWKEFHTIIILYFRYFFILPFQISQNTHLPCHYNFYVQISATALIWSIAYNGRLMSHSSLL